MRRLILTLFIVFGLSVNAAYPYWIWTPKSNKWVNPKTVAKDSPKAQFDYAKGFYDGKKLSDAMREFDKLIKTFPKSFEASEAQYYLGLIEEERGNLYQAFQAYQKVVNKYPFSERIKDIIEREYNIAERFIAGYKRKALGITIPVENPAIEILTNVVDNSTYGPLAPKAEYKLGLVLKGLQRYYEAEDAFNKVIANYPESEWVEPSRFQIASCRAAVSRGPDYDQGAMQDAKQKFEEFVKDHPDAVLSKDAEDNIGKLKEKEAAASFNIARFYEKQEDKKAAKIYYNNILENYPNSPWASKAAERLRLMEKKK